MEGLDRIKKFFGLTHVDKQLWFWKYNCFFLFGLAPYGVFLPSSSPSSRYFWVSVRFNNFIVTYLRRLSTLVLEVQPYLIILIWPHLGVFLAVFRPFGAFFGLDLGLNTFLKPVYVDYQFWLWNYSPICFFFIRPLLGPFWIFLGPLGLFLGLGSGPNPFLGPTYIA